MPLVISQQQGHTATLDTSVVGVRQSAPTTLTLSTFTELANSPIDRLTKCTKLNYTY